MTPKVPDYGHREADKELYALIRRLHLSYRQARISLMEKIEEYMDQFEKEDAMKRALYDSGELSHEEFLKWRQMAVIDTQAWRDMLEQLAEDMTHQNEIAASMINDTLPDVYALNHNYGTFEVEKGSGYDTTYTMYDKNTVKRLLTENEDLLPHPSVPVAKDLLWNKQHLQSAVLQGILTGDSMSDIAKRFQSVTDMTERAAMRNARTAVTGAENAGRIDSYIRAQNMGIKMKQMWMATLDSRTRDSHAIMDGEQQEVGKKFSNGCRYPGDPQGAPGEIWNCRCTTVAMVEGADPYNPNLRPSEYLKEEGLTYEQWKEMHGERFYSKLFGTDYNETENKTFDRSKVQYSSRGQFLRDHLEKSGIEWREVHLLQNQLSEDEIINRLAGGDKTKGSCFSLACAFAGNKNGLDVIDFRGGKSQEYFAGAYYAMYQFDWINAKIEHKGGLNPAKKLLKQMEEGHEYIFTTGKHSAITRIINGDMQYLELQSQNDSGWHSFEEEKKYNKGQRYTVSEILKWRFGCGTRAVSDSTLIDIDVFKNNDEFRDLLGYINTAEDQQKKGVSGGIR